MKKSTKIILIILCVIVAIIIGVVALFKISLRDNGTYNLGNDTVTSINGVLDEKKVISSSSSIENGVRTVSKTYQTSGNVKSELLKYANYIMSNEGFLLIKDEEGKLEVAKQSVDAGDLVYMTIEYDSNYYTVTIKKGEGTLTQK